VYPKNNKEVVPKLHLGSEQNMETNSSTHPRSVQKIWTIRNRYDRRYAKTYIPPTISLSDGRCLTRLRAGYDHDKETRVIPRVLVRSVSHPFNDQMECIPLCVPRDQSHIS
jgi:hypothetical protein